MSNNYPPNNYPYQQQQGSYPPPPNPYITPPPPPAPRKSRKGLWIALGFVGFLLLFSCIVASVMAATSAPQKQHTVAFPTTQHNHTPTRTPQQMSTVKLTSAQKQQVQDILHKNMMHYQQLLSGGKAALGTTQYADGTAGLVAYGDPTSNASQFRDWRKSSHAEQDVSYLDAFKQADAFYNADNEPAAISTWRDDMGTAQSDLVQWVNVAVGWQIRTNTTDELHAAEQQFQHDMTKAQADVTALINAS